MICRSRLLLSFFFNYTSTTDIYTLSLHDALPISPTPTACRRTSSTSSADQALVREPAIRRSCSAWEPRWRAWSADDVERSEEHTSELQSLRHLVCRLLLEKKKHKRET